MITQKNDMMMKLEDLEIIQDLSDEQSSLLVGGASILKTITGWLVYDDQAGQCYEYHTQDDACE